MVAIGVWLIPRTIIDRAMAMTLLKVGVSGGVMVVAVLSVKALGVAVVPTAAVAACAYVASALVTRTITPGDLLFVVDTARRKLRPPQSSNVR